MAIIYEHHRIVLLSELGDSVEGCYVAIHAENPVSDD